MGVEVIGLKRLQKRMRLFTPKLQRVAMRKATSAAATPVMRIARKLMPSGQRGGVALKQTPSSQLGPTPRRFTDKNGRRILSRPLKRTLSKRTRTYTKGRAVGTTVTIIGHRSKESPHAHLVHDGTRSHAITTKSAKSLYSGAKNRFFGRSVRHPGTRGVKYLTRAINRGRPAAMRVMVEKLKQGLRQLAKL